MDYNDYFKKIEETTREGAVTIGNVINSLLKASGCREGNRALNNVGIETENKTTEEVLNELVAKWKSLDRDTQIDLGVKIAGMTGKEAYAIGRLESFIVKSVRDKYEEVMEEFSDYINKQRNALVEMGVEDEEADKMIRRALLSGMEQAVSKMGEEMTEWVSG